MQFVSYSPSGIHIACLVDVGNSGGIYVYHARTGALVYSAGGARGERYHRCGFSGDSRWLVASMTDGSLKFWDMRLPQPIGTLRGPATRLIHFAFSGDDHWLATCTPDGKVLVWEKDLLEPCTELAVENEVVGPLAFSADGKTLASCTPDRRVVIIDPESAAIIVRLPNHIDTIRDLAFSPDGTRLLTTDGETVRSWNWREGAEQWSSPGHRATSVCWSPESELVASAGYDSMIHLYHANDGSEVGSWTGYAAITGLRFLPGKPLLVSTGNDGFLRLWDFAMGQRFARSDVDEAVRLRDIDAGGPMVAAFPAMKQILQFALSADGRAAALGLHDGELRVLRFNDRMEPEATMKPLLWAGAPPSSFAFSPDGQTLGLGGNLGTFQATDATTQEARYSLSGRRVGARSLAYGSDGRTLGTISREGCLTLWDLTQWQTRTLCGSPLMPVQSLAFSADGRALAVATDDSIPPDRPLTDNVPAGPNVRRFASRQAGLSLGTDRSIHSDGTPWDRSGAGLSRLGHGHSARTAPPAGCMTPTAISCVAWSKEGILAAGSRDGTVWIWNTGESKLIMRFAVNAASDEAIGWQPRAGRALIPPKTLERLDSVTALAFLADGSKLAVATRSGIVQLVDAADWENRTTLLSEASNVACLAFSPSGSTLVANRGGQVLCWDLNAPARTPVPRLFGEMQDSPIASVAFRHEGQTLAIGRHDGTVQFFTAQFLDADQGATSYSSEPLVLTGHLDRVAAMCFSPDDQTLATGSWDATVRLWHVASGQELAVLRAHHDKVEAVTFSPDGSVLASGGHRDADHGEVFLWAPCCDQIMKRSK